MLAKDCPLLKPPTLSPAPILTKPKATDNLTPSNTGKNEPVVAEKIEAEGYLNATDTENEKDEKVVAGQIPRVKYDGSEKP